MRRTRDCEWLKDEQGNIVGLNLGADYCSEHEHGIASLQASLGVKDDPSQIGIERRKITRSGDFIILDGKKKGITALLVDPNLAKDLTAKDLPYEIKPPRGASDTLACAWDQKSLGIVAKNPEDRKNLKELIAAIKNQDAAMWIGGAGVFKNGGLILCIISKISDSNRQTMVQADEDFNKLRQADQTTGIREKLKAAGKSFYALAPGWKLTSTKDGEVKTKYSIMYWLNPQDQKNNESGWYTVEQLEQWIMGQGPIIKTSEKVS